MIKRWECPNCSRTHATNEPLPHTPFHTCAGIGGLMAPFVPAGTPCKVEVNDREDYVGKELVQVDAHGRPVMSVTVTRDDGQDCTVYAPVATADARR